MSVPTIEKLAEAYWEAVPGGPLWPEIADCEPHMADDVRAGIRAVLRALQPTWAEAFYEGTEEGFRCYGHNEECSCASASDRYAAALRTSIEGEG
jgi:hypothetical protein